MTYDIQTIATGTDFIGAEFITVVNGSALVLTGADIIMTVFNKRYQYILSTDNSKLIINDGTPGSFSIAEQVINFEPAMYDYHVKFIIPGNEIKTYIIGKWEITQ